MMPFGVLFNTGSLDFVNTEDFFLAFLNISTLINATIGKISSFAKVWNKLDVFHLSSFSPLLKLDVSHSSAYLPWLKLDVSLSLLLVVC